MREELKFRTLLNKWVHIWTELTDGTPEIEKEASIICSAVPMFKFYPQTAAAACVYLASKKHNPVSKAEICRITTFSPNTISKITEYLDKRK